MEGTLSPVACLGNGNYACSRRENCRTLPLWIEYDKLVKDFFYSKKLTDLLAPPQPESYYAYGI